MHLIQRGSQNKFQRFLSQWNFYETSTSYWCNVKQWRITRSEYLSRFLANYRHFESGWWRDGLSQSIRAATPPPRPALHIKGEGTKSPPHVSRIICRNFQTNSVPLPHIFGEHALNDCWSLHLHWCEKPINLASCQDYNIKERNNKLRLGSSEW